MLDSTTAILPCLGEGSRMRPLSLGISKVFLPFCNRPVIEYTLEQLTRHGVRTIVLVAGYGDHFADRYVAWGAQRSVKIWVLKRGLEYGSGGVVRDVIERSPFLRGYRDFLIVYADSILALDFRRLFDAYRTATRQECQMMLVCHTPDDLVPSIGSRSSYGVLRPDHARRIVRFREKPFGEEIKEGDVASAGVFLLNRRALARFPKILPLDLSHDVLESLASGPRSSVFAFDIGGGFRYDVGTISEYVKRQFALLVGQLRVPGTRLRGVRRGGSLCGGGRVCGTAMIGRDSRLGRGATLEGVNVVGHNVRVGSDSTLKNSIVFDHVQIGKRACVSGSVLGSHCVIGDSVVLNAGTVLGDHSVVS